MKGSYILPILLIILTLVVLSKHYDSKMKLEQKIILGMIFLMIAYTAFSYMKLDDIVEKYSNQRKEGFSSMMNSKKSKFKDVGASPDWSSAPMTVTEQSSVPDMIVPGVDTDINEEISEDLDVQEGDEGEGFENTESSSDLVAQDTFNKLASSPLEKEINKSKFTNMNNKSKNKAGKSKNNKERFEMVPPSPQPTGDVFNIAETNSVGPIKALFNPQIRIKSKDRRDGASSLGFDWSSAVDQIDQTEDNYVNYQSDYYNKDFWRKVPDYNRPSWDRDTSPYNAERRNNRTMNGGADGETNQQYLETEAGADYRPYTYGRGTGYNRSTVEMDSQNPANKFPQDKIFYPGYSYTPPSNWDVPQLRPPVCYPNQLDTRKLPIGVMDYGTPVNALELNPEGIIAHTEDTVHLTNVGSMLPKFEHKVLPYALP